MPDSSSHLDNYDGLRSFIEACEQFDEIKTIEGADWNGEIATLSEAVAEHITHPRAILFDKIKGYPPGYRVLSLVMAAPKRIALMTGAPLDLSQMELARWLSRRLIDSPPIPPRTVKDGPVMQNVKHGDEIDLTKFPVLQCHEHDGGRYIGTGDNYINRDPETGYVNVATYRMQMHEKDLLGVMHGEYQHGRMICEKWWAQGKACPVVATFGGDPLMLLASASRFPFGTPELDAIGAIRGAPVDVIEGPITGLPIPAHAEIAIEGEVPPPSEEMRKEGPFGEWPGYYAGGHLGHDDMRHVIRVKALYHRNDPILLNMAPQWPGAPYHSVRLLAGALWEQMEAAGVPNIQGVHMFNQFFVVVSIKQQYAGHARQAGMAALGSTAAAGLGKYVVIVDEDIDPTNLQEVLWAMETRVDPESDIQIITGTNHGPLEPIISPEKRAANDYRLSKAVFYAVRPFHWKDEFPRVNRAERDALANVIDKYRDEFPFPRSA